MLLSVKLSAWYDLSVYVFIELLISVIGRILHCRGLHSITTIVARTFNRILVGPDLCMYHFHLNLFVKSYCRRQQVAM